MTYSQVPIQVFTSVYYYSRWWLCALATSNPRNRLFSTYNFTRIRLFTSILLLQGNILLSRSISVLCTLWFQTHSDRQQSWTCKYSVDHVQHNKCNNIRIKFPPQIYLLIGEIWRWIMRCMRAAKITHNVGTYIKTDAARLQSPFFERGLGKSLTANRHRIAIIANPVALLWAYNDEIFLPIAEPMKKASICANSTAPEHDEHVLCAIFGCSFGICVSRMQMPNSAKDRTLTTKGGRKKGFLLCL